MVCPSPHGSFAHKFNFVSATSCSIARRSFLKVLMLAFHSFSLGGPSEAGQYPSGHAGETCLELRLNSRMSHCARRMCSSSIHAVCGKFATFTPANCTGQ